MNIRVWIIGFGIALSLLTVSAKAEWTLEEAQQQAELGDPVAQIALGFWYYEGLGVPQDKVKAAEWYRKAAEQGYPGGKVALGRMYLNGEGVNKDYSRAKDLFLSSAEQRWHGGAGMLGEMYREGKGVAKDYVRAYMWFNVAAVYDTSNYSTWRSARDMLEKKMTSSQVALAQRMTNVWLDTNPPK